MHRRDALQRIGLVAAVGSTSGCAAILQGGPEKEAGDDDRKRSGSLETTDLIPPREGETGDIVVGATVTNHGDSKSSATLEVRLEIDESVHDKTTKVTVPGGEKKDFDVRYDIEFEKYETAERTSVSLNLK